LPFDQRRPKAQPGSPDRSRTARRSSAAYDHIKFVSICHGFILID
jgi:hypothetical protein